MEDRNQLLEDVVNEGVLALTKPIKRALVSSVVILFVVLAMELPGAFSYLFGA